MREYRILADERSAEDLSDLFLEKGALAASLEDADADSTDEAPLYGEPGLEPETCAWPRSIISVLTESNSGASQPSSLTQSSSRFLK